MLSGDRKEGHEKKKKKGREVNKKNKVKKKKRKRKIAKSMRAAGKVTASVCSFTLMKRAKV